MFLWCVCVCVCVEVFSRTRLHTHSGASQVCSSTYGRNTVRLYALTFAMRSMGSVTRCALDPLTGRNGRRIGDSDMAVICRLRQSRWQATHPVRSLFFEYTRGCTWLISVPMKEMLFACACPVGLGNEDAGGRMLGSLTVTFLIFRRTIMNGFGPGAFGFVHASCVDTLSSACTDRQQQSATAAARRKGGIVLPMCSALCRGVVGGGGSGDRVGSVTVAQELSKQQIKRVWLLCVRGKEGDGGGAAMLVIKDIRSHVPLREAGVQKWQRIPEECRGS